MEACPILSRIKTPTLHVSSDAAPFLEAVSLMLLGHVRELDLITPDQPRNVAYTYPTAFQQDDTESVLGKLSITCNHFQVLRINMGNMYIFVPRSILIA